VHPLVALGRFEAHDHRRARVHRRQRADLQRVEHAEDVELPFLGDVRGVREESEGDMHAGS